MRSVNIRKGGRAPVGTRPLAVSCRLFDDDGDRLTCLELSLDVHGFLLVDRDVILGSRLSTPTTRDSAPKVITWVALSGTVGAMEIYPRPEGVDAESHSRAVTAGPAPDPAGRFPGGTSSATAAGKTPEPLGSWQFPDFLVIR